MLYVTHKDKKVLSPTALKNFVIKKTTPKKPNKLSNMNIENNQTLKKRKIIDFSIKLKLKDESIISLFYADNYY